MPNTGNREDGMASFPPSITFGLEIEMLVAATGALPIIGAQQSPWTDPHHHDPRWKATKSTQTQSDSEDMVARALSFAGLENVWIEYRPDTRLSSGTAQTSHALLPKIDSKYNNWRIMGDGSLSVEEWIATDPVLGKYSWPGVEIASAVFHSWAGGRDVWILVGEPQRRQIAEVCRCLTYNMRIRFSPCCGLHLHLGLGGDPIPGDTIRRFVTAMWLLEEAVLSLCAPWRATNKWARPITQFSRLASDSDEGRKFRAALGSLSGSSTSCRMRLDAAVWDRLSRDQQSQIQLIWALPLSGNDNINLVEAVSTCGESARGSVSVRGAILGKADTRHANVVHTIEIRYASGTLVANELVSWTNLFVRLFQLCNWYDECNAGRLDALIAAVLSAGDRGAGHAGHELLRQVGLGDDVGVWEAAGKRWAGEQDHDQVRKSPFFQVQQ